MGATLPVPWFDRGSADGKPDSHDIRSRAFDFNADGRMDVLVFSRPAFDGTEWPVQSAVQFLVNRGQGRFEDVTANWLLGYDHNTNSAYAPLFVDVNGDGRLDIFMSDSAFGAGPNRSTTLLIQQPDGRFQDTGRDLFSAYLDPMGGIATLAQGPSGQFFLVTEAHGQSGVGTVRVAPLQFPSLPLPTRLQEIDGWRAFDIAGTAGPVALTLGAVFGAAEVSNRSYVGVGLSLMDSGLDYEGLLGLALQVRLGDKPSAAQVVDLLFSNLVGRLPTSVERQEYVGWLDSGGMTPVELARLAADLDLNASNIDLVGLQQQGLSYLLA